MEEYVRHRARIFEGRLCILPVELREEIVSHVNYISYHCYRSLTGRERLLITVKTDKVDSDVGVARGEITGTKMSRFIQNIIEDVRCSIISGDSLTISYGDGPLMRGAAEV